MIALAKIRELDISSATSGDRPSHISAASGLVCVGSTFYVIADDELHLGVFSAITPEPGRLIRLFDGVLSDDKVERKRRKPDLEALTVVPPFLKFPHGALLAFGSGSRPNRRRGALFGLDAKGSVCGAPQELDLSPILGPLDSAFAELNIEGPLLSTKNCACFSAATNGKPTTPSFAIRFHWLSIPCRRGTPISSSLMRSTG